MSNVPQAVLTCFVYTNWFNVHSSTVEVDITLGPILQIRKLKQVG